MMRTQLVGPSGVVARLRGGLLLGWVGLVVLAFLSSAGCNDPYSQRRIHKRTVHLNETAADMIRREERGARRLKEADATLQKWWRTDCERFERRVPTVGDYFW